MQVRYETTMDDVQDLKLGKRTIWRPSAGIHECEGLGSCIELGTQNVLAQTDRESVTIKTTAAVEPKYNVERTVKVSRHDGLNLLLRCSANTRRSTFERNQRFETRRVPTEETKPAPKRGVAHST